jgi:hypothetical protein
MPAERIDPAHDREMVAEGRPALRQAYERPELQQLDVQRTAGKPFFTPSESSVSVGPGS